MKRALLFLCLLAEGLFDPLAALADHDDGDDVKEYSYVLAFDPRELSKFAGYVIVDSNDMDSMFVVSRRIGRDQGGLASRGDITLAYEGDIPVTIDAIPGHELEKVEGWARQEALRSADRVLSMEPEVMRRFEAAFGGKVHRMSYVRSPLLRKMLGIAKCKVHFLEAPGDHLKVIREHVALRYTSPLRAQIVPARYVFEYDDGSKVELPEEKARRLTDAECRALLNPKGKKATGSPVPLDRLWPIAAPSFAAVMLAGIAIRRRRGMG